MRCLANLINFIYNYSHRYNFTNAHLGDQDLYTLLALHDPGMFAHLPCQWNRQLCQFWCENGYAAECPAYQACPGPIHLWHGNCNAPLPPPGTVE